MKDKFTMKLVWHNCETYPPEEYWNESLYVTDGWHMHEVEYFKERGWWSKQLGDYIPANLLNKYWWADIGQTVQKTKGFKED